MNTMVRPVIRKISKVAVVVVWSALTGLLLCAFMPDNPLRPPKVVKDNLTAFAPQGWVFFTRNPREASDRVYRRTNPCCESIVATNGDAEHMFGIQRDPRAQGVELGTLVAQVPEKAWQPCRGDLAACIAKTTPAAVKVVNRSAVRSMCGEVIVERRPPIPWAWSRSNRVNPPYSLLVMNVSCR